MKIDTEVDARKEAIGADDVWGVLGQAKRIYVASGRKTMCYEPDEDNREELVARATGRTGNLRAPAVRTGGDLYIGFNASLYETAFK